MLLHLPGTVRLTHARDRGTSFTTRTRFFLPALLATLVVVLTLSLAWPATAQEAAPLVVASGPLSERTLVLTGRTVQTPEQLHLFGFVNGASGLVAQDLYADDTAQAGSARFTFVADVTLEPATNRADTTLYSGEGTLRIFLAADGGAAGDDPASFSAGELVAEYDLALRETLQRQASQVGVLVGDGNLTQTTANTFSLDDTTYRFGVEGLGQRLRYTGGLTPDTAGSTLAAVINGYAVVTDRDVTVVRMGQTSTPSGTPTAHPDTTETPAATSNCVLDSWLSDATAALDVADQGLGSLDLSAIGDVDSDAVQDLATQIDAAVATLRGSAPPAEATDANRLLVTALSTTSRGLRGITAAVASEDEATFTQSTGALGDGQTLLTQAQEAIDQLATVCPAG